MPWKPWERSEYEAQLFCTWGMGKLRVPFAVCCPRQSRGRFVSSQGTIACVDFCYRHALAAKAMRILKEMQEKGLGRELSVAIACGI